MLRWLGVAFFSFSLASIDRGIFFRNVLPTWNGNGTKRKRSKQNDKTNRTITTKTIAMPPHASATARRQKTATTKRHPRGQITKTNMAELYQPHGKTPADQLFGHDDIGPYLFSFLEPRELFHLAFASKDIMRLLQHKHVVRSAMMVHVESDQYKGNITMKELVQYIAEQSIWTPSPLRMLRLVNATGCERCSSRNIRWVSLGCSLCGGSYCRPGCLNELSSEVQFHYFSSE